MCNQIDNYIKRLHNSFFKACCSFYFFLSAFHYHSAALFDMRREGQIYSMLISPVHAQSKSSLQSDALKSSLYTDWSNFLLQFLLLLHAFSKCDNVLCSEIHTISVHLAPNVSKMPVSFSGWMAGLVESGLLQEWTLVKKKSPMEGSCLTACHQPFKA